MLTLGIDTTTTTVGLALLEDEEIRAEFFLNLQRHHSEVLLPALDALFCLAGTQMTKVDLICCTMGPGSFTGVRIGASTVKGLVLATGKPIVGVSTLEALALNLLPRDEMICPMLDARRNMVYTGLYRMGENGLPQSVCPDQLTDIETFLGNVKEKAVFVGDGAIQYEKQIVETLPLSAILAGKRHMGIRASAVARIGIHRCREGRLLNPLTFSPEYLRTSEAERNKQAGIEA